MASRYEVEVKISSAKDIKNVNWRHGPTRPYAVVWVDPRNKCSTRVDDQNDTNPVWDDTLVIPLPAPIDDDTALYIDIVHAGSEPDTKRLIGSARLHLREVVDEVGYGERAARTLKLVRPSGRPHGKLDVKVSVRDPHAYAAPPPAPAAYGSGAAYDEPPRDPYYAAAPPSGYAYDPYGGAAHGASGYGAPPVGSGYGTPPVVAGYGAPVEEKKKSKFGGMGMGTGLAVGAAAGVLGGLAIAEGVDYVEDEIADDVAEKVEDDLGYDGDDF